MLTGGCYCGRVRFEVSGEPAGATLCHCADCRRVSAAPAVAWFTIGSEDFRLTGEQPVFFQSSANATRSFCPNCGTPLTFAHRTTPHLIDVTTCSLDQPEAVPPLDHVWSASSLSWLPIDDRLPVFTGSRDV